MFDIEGLGETEQQTTGQVGAGGFMFASPEDDVVIVQSINQYIVYSVIEERLTGC